MSTRPLCAHRRYWFDTRPNLRRTVEERALQFPEEDIDVELERRVREASRRSRGDLRGVHVCPPESADVPDEPRARLVVLRPSAVHRPGAAGTAALGASANILENRGAAPRQHRNMLMFLAPDGEAMDGLRQETRRFLAWQSVDRDKDALNLDANQRREAAEGRKTSDGNVAIFFAETWRWLLVPAQTVSDGQVGELEFEAIGADGGEDSIIARAARRLRAGDYIIPTWSPALLKMELDRWFWRDRDHVSVKAVWEALSAYCYLPRLVDEGVFAETVGAGVASGDYFGFAASVAEDGRYEGLAMGECVTVHVDASSVLVKPEVAHAQTEAARPVPGGGTQRDESGAAQGGPGTRKNQPPAPRLARRFFATVAIDPDRAGRDMGDVAEGVLQNLTTLPGAKVRVTVEIEGEFSDGVPGDVQRVVGENCGTLRFKAHGFEEG